MKLLLLAIVILSVVCPSCAKTDYGNVLVTEVFDGDTLCLVNGEKVRLLGIDTPEMYDSEKLYRDAQRTGQDREAIMAQGRQAYQFTRGLVEGKTVRLEFDLQKRDRYGRLLAYVYIPVKPLGASGREDALSGTELFLNAEILQAGYAQPMIIEPNLKYADYFRKLYWQASKDKRGLWGNY